MNTFVSHEENIPKTNRDLNVLFLTLFDFKSIDERNIYADLLREFSARGHNVYVVSPTERRNKEKTHLIEDRNGKILKLKIGNTQKTNIFEKGISTIMIESQFKAAIKKYFGNIRFDLVLYSTPPITLVSAIDYVKSRDNAGTYLLLKDIFPQNAVDIDLMRKNGLRGLIYSHFRKQEKKLYAISDHIGCMSRANVDYVILHNPDVDPSKVEICPNSVDVIDKSTDKKTAFALREKYGLPTNKKIFVYGGNLGKPQGIPYLIECLRKCQKIDDAFFFIVGDGTEFHLLKNYIDREKPNHVKLLPRLPKEDYDAVVGACDVGLIILDHRFTIPNFPSRLLSYMQAKIPVLAATDVNTDIGNVISGIDKNGRETHKPFGWWCESNDPDKFAELVKDIMQNDIIDTESEFGYLMDNYHCSKSVQIILNSVKSKCYV